MTEDDFLARLRALPLHPGALGLADDAARLGAHVLTTDTLVEGVHFVPADPPGDVAWKLVAVNLSDLAAKGARPDGVLLNYPLSDDGWDQAFLAGLGEALDHFACPLLGGDTVSLPPAAPRVLTLTAIGTADAAPARSGAQPGDLLWVTGTIGDAGAGLAIAQGAIGPASLLAAYRRPRPRLADGLRLAPLAHATADVSDGLLLDAARMAAASGLGVEIDLSCVPMSPDLVAFAGAGLPARLAAATAGDDYQLLLAAPIDAPWPVLLTPVGRFTAVPGLSLVDAGAPVPLPPRLGFCHAATPGCAPPSA